MSAFNQSRKNIVVFVFVLMFIVIIAQLAHLQLFSSDLRLQADAQGTFRKVVYPDRGIIYDRHKKSILQNTIIYDLMVTPNKLKGVDTVALCKILNIDTAQFNKKIVEVIIKNGRTRTSVFEALLSDDKQAMLNESMYLFTPGFYLQERSVRSYPFNAAANVLGYTAEVDTNFLKKHKNEGYVSGDYAGMTGIERSYEKVLMGERGIEYWKRDNKNRLTEKLENGKYDTIPIAGNNLHTSLDIELQELGEKLMQNKLGAIVAIDPKTGGILAMVSAPTYQPKFLTGSERRKHFSELFLNPALPLLNRTVSATYSPGSTFKTLQALVGLHEGVITPSFQVSCSGAFYGCGSAKPMKCLDRGVFNLRSAITVSDNTYFATVMQRVINNPEYPSIDSSLTVWNNYMYAFGLGHKLGVDLPSEKRGNIPTPASFNKEYGKGRWNYCTFRSVSIGQGEVDVTPLQVANEMAYLANKGWYKIPHLIDSIEGGDTYGMLTKFNKKHTAVDIPDSVFEAVHDGMQGVMETGTGSAAKVPGIVVCGKTGTVENAYRGVKQKDHAFFAAFAPRDNPTIAIAVICENAGFGASSAAPIASFMIEQYLRDSIPEPDRKAQVEAISKLNLMPLRIYKEMRYRDSLLHSKDTSYLLTKGYLKIIKDTMDMDEADNQEALDKLKKAKQKEDQKKKDTQDKNQNKPNSEGLLPDEKKKAARDSSQ